MNKTPKNKILVTLSILLTGILFVSCSSFDPLRGVAGSYRNYYEVKGKIADGRYTSPDKNFSCAIPQLIQPGAVIRDKTAVIQGGIMGTVGFEDDMGQLFRIDWFEITPDNMKKLEITTIQPSLTEAILAYEMQLFRSISPNTVLETEEQSGTNDTARIFAVITAPQASSLATNGKRDDSTRGFSIFVKNSWVYAVSIQDTAPYFGSRNENKDDRNKKLKADLDKFENTIAFN